MRSRRSPRAGKKSALRAIAAVVEAPDLALLIRRAGRDPRRLGGIERRLARRVDEGFDGLVQRFGSGERVAVRAEFRNYRMLFDVPINAFEFRIGLTLR